MQSAGDYAPAICSQCMLCSHALSQQHMLQLHAQKSAQPGTPAHALIHKESHNRILHVSNWQDTLLAD